jgi:hypothetical protein
VAGHRRCAVRSGPSAGHLPRQFADPQIAESLHIPLLWRLRRIVSPVFRDGGRSWSFSTSEPLQGNPDPATLPGIVFRPTQDARSAGSPARREIASRPFGPGGLEAEGIHAELAGWLVAEYRKRGGDELRRLVENWCGAEPQPQPRLRKVRDELRIRHGPTVSHRIFMSYRHGEDPHAAGRLRDRLSGYFGSDQVFRDTDSIPGGDDFVETITNPVRSCDVLLALIGSRWLTLADGDGRRRLDEAGDFVRLEIAGAPAGAQAQRGSLRQ